MKLSSTLTSQTARLRSAFLLVLMASATILAACSETMTEGMSEDEADPAAFEDSAAAVEKLSEPADSTVAAGESAQFSVGGGIQASACGDGIQAKGELCYKKPAKVTTIAGELGGLAVGKIDAGGTQDFVVAAVTQDKIRTRFGSGNGLFWGTHTWSIGDGPTDVALGDFNNDGKTDIIATNVHQSRVRIRWGHSNWSTSSVWATGAGPWRVVARDINNDGLDDFVTTNVYSNTISVRKRKATGGFTNQSYAAGESANDVQLADCDNDGDLDLFYPSGLHHATIQVRRNNGSGSFGAPITINMNSGYNDNFQGIVLTDLNKDGRVDLVAARNSHALVRVLGNGNCSFQAPVVAPVPNNPYRIYAHDFDKDGNKDLIVSHLLAARVSVFLGAGNGNLAAPKIYDATFGVNGHTSDVGVADFNGDGTLDILFNGSDGVYIMRSNP